MASTSSTATPSAYKEEWLTGPSATKFYTRLYTPPSPPRAAIVFLHGFAEHIGRYTHYHPLFSSRGIALFAFDQRGFGLTAQDKSGQKSKSSVYGKTSWKDQTEDIDWAIGHVGRTLGEGVPVFLYGHSMGGAEALAYTTQCATTHSNHKTLKAVIATSPLVAQTRPAPKIARLVGGFVSGFLPTQLIPAPVEGSDLSRDPEVGIAYKKDPLVVMAGSLKGLSDMLNLGDTLLKTGHTKWPKDLPLLIIHGTEDKVTSHKASQTFHDKIAAVKKKISLFDGGYHELHNEPGDVKERLANEIIAFIEEHLPAASLPAKEVAVEVAPAVAEAAVPEPTAEPETEAKADESTEPTTEATAEVAKEEKAEEKEATAETAAPAAEATTSDPAAAAPVEEDTKAKM